LETGAIFSLSPKGEKKKFEVGRKKEFVFAIFPGLEGRRFISQDEKEPALEDLSCWNSCFVLPRRRGEEVLSSLENES
jgi:hypothetical protein